MHKHMNVPIITVLCIVLLLISRWGCAPGKYTLKFEAAEICYLVKGRVKVYPKGGSSSFEFVEFGAGDIVTIPKGLGCTWDVSTAIDKHYKFEYSPLHPRSQSSSSIDIDLS